MTTADLIKYSLDACECKELDRAIHFACLAVDGTTKKMYPDIQSAGARFSNFISDNLDIIELMFGGLSLKETVFSFKGSEGNIGIRFEKIFYETFRRNLAHGEEPPDRDDVTLKVIDGIQEFAIEIAGRSMTLLESAVYALGLPCVLAPVNADQKIGNNLYHFHDPINHYVVDRWWGKIECARKIMDFEH